MVGESRGSSAVQSRSDASVPRAAPFGGRGLHTPGAGSAPSDSGARDEHRPSRLLSSLQQAPPNAAGGCDALSASLFPLPLLGSGLAPAVRTPSPPKVDLRAPRQAPSVPPSSVRVNGSPHPAFPPASGIGSLSSPSLPAPSPTADYNAGMQLSAGQPLGAPVPQLAPHASLGSHEPPPLASLLTPADASLLSALLHMQQRQVAAQQLAAAEVRMPRSMRSGHGRHNANHATSSLYKTELCRSWQESGSCRYGNKCQFAHGPGELRPVQRHPKYKTENCRTFALNGFCPYGARCRFIHAHPQLAPPLPAAFAAAAQPQPCCPALLPPGHAASLQRLFAAVALGGGTGDSCAPTPQQPPPPPQPQPGSGPFPGYTPVRVPSACEEPQGRFAWPQNGLSLPEPSSPYPATPPALQRPACNWSPLTRSAGSGLSDRSSIDSPGSGEPRRLPVFKAFEEALY